MISKRLLTVVSLLKGRNIIDVGADHGELELYLVKNNLADKVLAIENKIGPFERLKKATSSLEEVTPILSNGLESITSDIDTVVIAGMGGQLIKKIIEKDFEKLSNVKQIVVDAHRDNELLRRFLIGKSFKIEREIIVKEKGIYYFVISFIRGEQTLQEDEYLYGYLTQFDPLWKEYKEYELARLTKLVGLNNSVETKNKIRRLNEHEHD